MPELIIHQEKVTPDVIRELKSLCPFGAFEEDEAGNLQLNASCRLCRLCVRRGPDGVMEYKEDDASHVSACQEHYRGILVYADTSESSGSAESSESSGSSSTSEVPGGASVHPVAYELLGKAKTLSLVSKEPVFALLIGSYTPRELSACTDALLSRGAEKVFVYDHPIFASYCGSTFARAFTDFVEKTRPSSILVGATNTGRSLAPRAAAALRTGLTADCTELAMKEDGSLVQIRPAFGGNIMAQIVTPRTRPQFCTVRYKVFSAPEPLPENALPNPRPVEILKTDPAWKDSRVQVNRVLSLPPVSDISEADILVAVGRGLKKTEDLPRFQRFAERLGGKIACTRPLVENGTLPASCQIGLSGKTVKPKLIFTFGISGAVQFAAGMNRSETIVAVNSDPQAPIFDIAHYGLTGDMMEILQHLEDALFGKES